MGFWLTGGIDFSRISELLGLVHGKLKFLHAGSVCSVLLNQA